MHGKYDYLVRISISGEKDSGKTSLINSFIDGTFFSKNYSVKDRTVKKIEISKEQPVELVILNRGADGDFPQDSYDGKCNAYIVTVDMTDRNTFELIEKNLNKISAYRYERFFDCVFFLVGTKCDGEKQVSEQELIQKATKLNCFCGITSAKEDLNIKQLFLEVTILVINLLNSDKTVLEKYNTKHLGTSTSDLKTFEEFKKKHYLKFKAQNRIMPWMDNENEAKEEKKEREKSPILGEKNLLLEYSKDPGETIRKEVLSFKSAYEEDKQVKVVIPVEHKELQELILEWQKRILEAFPLPKKTIKFKDEAIIDKLEEEFFCIHLGMHLKLTSYEVEELNEALKEITVEFISNIQVESIDAFPEGTFYFKLKDNDGKLEKLNTQINDVINKFVKKINEKIEKTEGNKRDKVVYQPYPNFIPHISLCCPPCEPHEEKFKETLNSLSKEFAANILAREKAFCFNSIILSLLHTQKGIVKYIPIMELPKSLLLNTYDMEKDYFDLYSNDFYTSEFYDDNPVALYYRLDSKLKTGLIYEECYSLYLKVSNFYQKNNHSEENKEKKALINYALGLLNHYIGKNIIYFYKLKIDLEKAKEHYETAYQNGYEPACLQLALIYCELKKWDKVYEYFNKAMRIGEGDSRVIKIYQERKTMIENQRISLLGDQLTEKFKDISDHFNQQNKTKHQIFSYGNSPITSSQPLITEANEIEMKAIYQQLKNIIEDQLSLENVEDRQQEQISNSFKVIQDLKNKIDGH